MSCAYKISLYHLLGQKGFYATEKDRNRFQSTIKASVYELRWFYSFSCQLTNLMYCFVILPSFLFILFTLPLQTASKLQKNFQTLNENQTTTKRRIGWQAILHTCPSSLWLCILNIRS